MTKLTGVTSAPRHMTDANLKTVYNDYVNCFGNNTEASGRYQKLKSEMIRRGFIPPEAA